jgi:PAS domain S-box-containing protein
MDVPENRELFFEMSLDLHCIASPQAKLLHVNQRWEQVLGYTKEELKGGPFSISSTLTTSPAPSPLSVC